MPCKIKRNQNNEIVNVLDSQGIESSLYKSIAKHPLVQSNEEALNIYKNSQLPKIGEDATLVHKVGDITTTSYREALQAAKPGDDIKIGLQNTQGEYFNIITTEKTTNKNTVEGFTNFYIESGILNEDKKRVGNDYHFQPKGQDELARSINSQILREDAKAFLGTEGLTEGFETFQFDKTMNTIMLQTKNGEERISYEQLDQMTPQEVKRKFDNPDLILLERELYKNQPAYRNTTFTNQAPTRTEKELQKSLLSLLSKLGVTTMGISEYMSKYQARNGVNPNAEALADIANQVIAYSQGEISIENLTEETAHFIAEAMPIEQTQDILRNIHRTQEYAEYADRYREIYRSEYNEADLEDAVRREVLGKVIVNSIKNNFSTENKTGTQVGIINRIKQVFDSVIDTVRNMFKPLYRQELDVYLEDINRIIQSKDITTLNTDNFKFNKHRLYSVSKKSPLTKSIEKAIEGVNQQMQALSSESGMKGQKRGKLVRLEEDLNNKESLKAVSSVIDMAKNDIRYLKASIKDSKDNNKSYTLSTEESIVFSYLNGIIKGSLNELIATTNRTNIKETGLANSISDFKKWEQVNSDVKETIGDIEEISSEISQAKKQQIERIVDDLIRVNNFSERNREDYIKWAEKAENDTNYIHATFGALAHSQDGMLRTLDYLIRKIHNQTDSNFTRENNRINKVLRDLGFDTSYWRSLIDGSYIINEYNQELHDKYTNEVGVVYAYKKAVPKTNLKDSEIIERFKEGNIELNLSTDQANEFAQQKRNWDYAISERPMTEEYYKNYEKRLDQAGIKGVSKEALRNYYSDMSKMKQKALNSKGQIDMTLLSEAERVLWRQLTENRQSMKNYTDENGVPKNGLRYVEVNGQIQTNENGAPLFEPTFDVNDENLHKEYRDAIIALDINKLDELNIAERKKSEQGIEPLPQGFIDGLRVAEAQGGEALVEFLKSNAYIGMSNDYWNNLETSDSLVERLRNEGSDEAISLSNNLLKAKTQLKNILKTHANKNQPTEIDGNALSNTAKDTVRTIQTVLDGYYREANSILNDEGNFSSDSILTANDAWLDHIDNLGIETAEEEFDAAKKHMTATSVDRTNSDFYTMGARAKEGKLQPSLQEIYDTTPGTDAQKLERTKKELVRRRLLPYYKKYTSVQYENFINTVGSGGSVEVNGKLLSMTDYIDYVSKQNVISIKPNYSFFDSNNSADVNPNYNKGYRGGYLQPKKGNIKLPNGDTVNFENNTFKQRFADKNSKDYKAYQAVMDFHIQNLDRMGVGRSYNVYLKPQFRQDTVERVNKTIKDPKRIGLAFKEAFTFTEDDQVKGDTTYGGIEKVIPKRGIYKIEDQNDVSNDLYNTMNMIAYESFLREQRINTYSDVMAVMDSIETRATVKDKKNDSTNAYKMATSAVDNSLFGIREQVTYEINLPFTDKKMDVAKVGKQLLSYVKTRNLGFNVIIPMTSLITGTAQRIIETKVGEFLESRSQKLGTKEFFKIAGESAKDFGSLNPKGKLNVLGQVFGSFDLKESFKNSSYGILSRTLPRIGMGLHTLSNFPLYGKAMLGVLHDFRLVEQPDGSTKMMRWYDYKIAQMREGKTTKEAKAQWGTMEADVIYNYIEVVDGQFNFKKQLEEKLTDYNEKEVIDRLTNHITSVNERIDGQMNNNDRNLASRDYRLNFFNTHRNYFWLALSHRFKSKSNNPLTGKLEEGSYITFFKAAKDYLNNFKELGATNLIKGFKKVWDDAGVDPKTGEIDFEQRELVRTNLKRIGIEWAILQVTLLTGLLLSQIGGDEDDPYILKNLNLLNARLNNELNSVQTGIVGSAYETLKTPFVGLDTVTNLANVPDLLNDEEIKHGSYRGMNKRERWLLKQTPGAKSMRDLTELTQTVNTYNFYNEKSYDNPLNPIHYFISKNLEE